LGEEEKITLSKNQFISGLVCTGKSGFIFHSVRSRFEFGVNIFYSLVEAPAESWKMF
jgi:hypothetical protein